jgi:hypothetical protein
MSGEPNPQEKATMKNDRPRSAADNAYVRMAQIPGFADKVHPDDWQDAWNRQYDRNLYGGGGDPDPVALAGRFLRGR